MQNDFKWETEKKFVLFILTANITFCTGIREPKNIK